MDSGSHDRAILTRFIAEMEAEFPAFRIVKKAGSPLSKAIDRALKIMTLGGQRQYLSHYYTVIGDTLYVPEDFDHFDPVDVVVTLRHERMHLRQRRRYTFIGMAIIYLLLPFPVGLAYGRARLEWEAYTETLRATLELKGKDALLSKSLKDRIVRQFTSPAYLWMWPFKTMVERWYDEAVERVQAEAARS